jgi:hypothetical protein
MNSRFFVIVFLSIFSKIYAQTTNSVIEKLKGNKISIIEINTIQSQNIEDKVTYLRAGYRFYEFINNSYTLSIDSTEIKGRGNSTWELPKKPFRLKLFKSKGFEGIPASRHWALLANFEDKSLSRTKLASDLGFFLGINYVPRSIPVELVLNNQHLGSYQLIEVVKIDPKRVDITTVNTKDNITSGGAIFELNYRRDETFNFYTNKGIPISIKEPDDLNAKSVEISNRHYDYLVNMLNKAEDVLYSSDFTNPSIGYLNYFNQNSIVDWYLTEEILKNIDVGSYSVFKYIDTKNKNRITYGPIWDFDLSSGNREDPYGFKVKVENEWMARFFEDPKFEKLVKEKWAQKRINLLSTMTSSINNYSRKLMLSALDDYRIWEHQARPSDKSFGDDVWYLKNWLKARVEWLDRQFSNSFISFFQIVQDGYFKTDEDQPLFNKLNASVSSDTSDNFFVIKKPLKGNIEVFSKTGDFKYTPNLNSYGLDTFYFSKGKRSDLFLDTGMVIIDVTPINDAPISTNYVDTILEDSRLVKSKINGLVNHSYDAEGDILAYNLIANVTNGILNFNPDGSFDYLPNNNFYGIDSFIYRAYDQFGNSDSAFYRIQVLPVNDNPVLKKDTLFLQIFQNERIFFDIRNDLLNGVYDVDNDKDELDIDFKNLYIRGSLKKENNQFIYTPNGSFNGIEVLTYQAKDKISYSEVAIIKIRVLPFGNVTSFDHIILYPNPSKGIVHFENLIVDRVLIFDYKGSRMNYFSYSKNGSNLMVNMENLRKGNYIIYMFYKNTVMAIKKIILI